MRLADGNQASVGDVIITRSNDRRLRLTATDWVKNGDRWTITRIGRRGDLTVRHNRSQLTVRLPADYVRTSTGLGYATTIHAAQGVTADTMHGLLTGQESRQQLYTMLTRGRHANHLYLQVVGDGDPHTVIRPDTISPRTPTETLQQILARDEAPVSASTLLRELNDPRPGFSRRSSATPTASTSQPNSSSDPRPSQSSTKPTSTSPDSPTEPAWPTLRAHLLALAAETGEHPLRHLLTAASGRDLRTAGDMAAVLYWRLPALTPTDPGPLPWLPAFQQRSMLIPSGATTWQSDPNWSPTSPTRSKTTPAKVTPSQSGHHREATRAPPSSAKSQCGGPPTASIPKTRDQPEERQLETLPALWKQRLDRDIARATYPPADARADERQAGRTAPSRSDDRQRPYQKPNGVRAGRPRTPHWSHNPVLRSSCTNWECKQQQTVAEPATSKQPLQSQTKPQVCPVDGRGVWVIPIGVPNITWRRWSGDADVHDTYLTSNRTWRGGGEGGRSSEPKKGGMAWMW